MKDNTNKNFWQRFAGIYTAFMSKNEAAYDAICKEFENYIDSEKIVLELACGTGQITFLMADKALEWTATDYSENMLKEALKRKAQEHRECKAEFETADATNLTYHKWTRQEFVEYVSKRKFTVIGDTLIKGKPACECVLVGKK